MKDLVFRGKTFLTEGRRFKFIQFFENFIPFFYI
jgi:hypothetical protein